MRCPPRAVTGQVFRLGQFPLPMGDLESPAHAKVVNGQDIRSPQIENKKHLDCPATDALDRGQPVDDFRVRQFVTLLKRGYESLICFLSKSENVR